MEKTEPGRKKYKLTIELTSGEITRHDVELHPTQLKSSIREMAAGVSVKESDSFIYYPPQAILKLTLRSEEPTPTPSNESNQIGQG